MASHVLFDTKAEFRLRLSPEPGKSTSAGRKDGINPAELESHARCVFKHERNGGPDPRTSAKAERRPVLILFELICQRFAWKEIFGPRVETAVSVSVQV